MVAWQAFGESVAVWVRIDESLVRRSELPVLGSRAMLVASELHASPVGAYRSLGLFAPVRMGLRLGFSAMLMVVDGPEARRVTTSRWGLPTRTGKLRWVSTSDQVIVEWPEPGFVLTAQIGGIARLPVILPARLLQHRTDGPVVVNGSVRGRTRRAMVSITTDDDDLAGLEGLHRGHHVAGLRMVTRPARRPVAVAFSLEAPITTEGVRPMVGAHRSAAGVASPLPQRAYSSDG
ncbi:MAG TPA: hypothetical protein VGA13_13965 [Acidimicrobiales bacterium]